MVEYLDLVEDVLTHGKPRQSQKPEKTIAVVGRQVRYKSEDGFPLITSRDLSGSWEKIIVAELLWIMSGSSNARDLHQYGSHLWDKWAVAAEQKIGYKNGELGPTYGHQMRHFANQTDQLTQVVDMLKRDPNTRRAKISLWNLGDVEFPDGKHVVDVAPCITSIHFLAMDGRLDAILEQRSADIPVGVPHDVAEWALFQRLVAQEVGLPAGDLVHNLGDAHIYNNQIPAMKELLKRQPLSRPEVTILPSTSGTIYDHKVSDFQLQNYNAHPKMSIPVAL